MEPTAPPPPPPRLSPLGGTFRCCPSAFIFWSHNVPPEQAERPQSGLTVFGSKGEGQRGVSPGTQERPAVSGGGTTVPVSEQRPELRPAVGGRAAGGDWRPQSFRTPTRVSLVPTRRSGAPVGTQGRARPLPPAPVPGSPGRAFTPHLFAAEQAPCLHACPFSFFSCKKSE